MAETAVELMPAERHVDIDPMALIKHAVENGMDKDYLVTLFELQKQVTRDRAAERYGRALAGFQKDCPPVVKLRHVKNRDGTPRYSFAPYEDVMTHAAPYLHRYAISVSITGPTRTDAFDLTVRVRVGIHYEDKPYMAPMPNMAQIMADLHVGEAQAFGAVHSYHKRYAVCPALGIVIIGEDTDARLAEAAGSEPLSDEQVRELNTLYDECTDLDGKRFMSWLRERLKNPNLEGLGHIPQSQFAFVRDALAKRAKKGAAQ